MTQLWSLELKGRRKNSFLMWFYQVNCNSSNNIHYFHKKCKGEWTKNVKDMLKLLFSLQKKLKSRVWSISWCYADRYVDSYNKRNEFEIRIWEMFVINSTKNQQKLMVKCSFCNNRSNVKTKFKRMFSKILDFGRKNMTAMLLALINEI